MNPQIDTFIAVPFIERTCTANASARIGFNPGRLSLSLHIGDPKTTQSSDHRADLTYIRDFDRLAENTVTAQELYDRMMDLDSHRVNPGRLQSSLRTVKP